MRRATSESVEIAILTKAPVPQLAKTRLIPALGAHGAAQLQERLISRAVASACAAGIGPVTLWAAPDAGHPLFGKLAARLPIKLANQPEGDLGERMRAASAAANLPMLLMGSDCPVLAPAHLGRAAAVLRRPTDCVIIPAEDGGYVLLGLRRAAPQLFTGMIWSVPTVLAETRRRLAASGLKSLELPPLWDVDLPADLGRLRDAGLGALLVSEPVLPA